jgi:hypothetical protein
LDEVESLLVMHFPSTSGADKKRKLELLRHHFSAAWTEIEQLMPVDRLRAGYDALHVELEGRPSRYGQAQAEAAPAVSSGEIRTSRTTCAAPSRLTAPTIRTPT